MLLSFSTWSSTLALRAAENALEASQDGEGQNDAAVLRLLEVASKQVGERPNVGGGLREVDGHRGD